MKIPFIKRTEKRDNSVNIGGLFSNAWSLLSNTSPTSSGELINEQLALQHVSVYACVRTIAESIGSLDFKLYKRLPKGREEAFTDALHRLLTISPNDEMSAPVMWESVAGSMALTGNSYIEVLRNSAGTAVGLYPLHPLHTEPVRLPNKKLAYKTSVGMPTGQTRIINSADMLHFPLFSFDGLKGLSPICQARQTIGLARASEKTGAKFFGNNSQPGGLLTPVAKVDEKDLINMKEWWERAQSGDNQGRVGVLPSDWKYTQLALSPEDSQFLETRQMVRTDIAALFRLNPSQIGDTTRLSGTNHENLQLDFVVNCLTPYLVRIEKEIARKLLPQDGSMFVEADLSARLRGDFATTQAGFATGRQWGWYNANTILEKLGENPIEGEAGSAYWAPVNMTNAANLTVNPTSGPELPAPTQDQRSLFSNYLPLFTNLFGDAVGRVTARSKRDIESISPILTPLLDSISSLAITEARKQFKLPDTWMPSDKAAKDYLKGVTTRAAAWTPEGKDAAIGEELSRALRTIHIGTFKEAGSAIAIRSLDADEVETT